MITKAFKNYSEADDFIKGHEQENGYKYSTWKISGGFNDGRFHWATKIHGRRFVPKYQRNLLSFRQRNTDVVRNKLLI